MSTLRSSLEELRAEDLRFAGPLSVASWLTARFRLAWSTAVRQVRQARALEAMPLAREALAEGDLSRSAVDVLVAARESNVEAFGRDEGSLVEAARTMPYAALRRVAPRCGGAAQPRGVARGAG